MIDIIVKFFLCCKVCKFSIFPLFFFYILVTPSKYIQIIDSILILIHSIQSNFNFFLHTSLINPTDQQAAEGR